MGVTLGWSYGLVLVAVVMSQLESELTPPRWRRLCPQLVPRALIGYTPSGEDKAGVYTKSPTPSTDLVTCVDQCCAEESCNIVFLYDNNCFKLQCESDELCEPVYKTDRSKFGGHVMMVLIRPVQPGVSWSDVLQLSDVLDDMAMSDSSKVEHRACDLSQLKCPVHEMCDPQFNLCTCVPGFTRDTNTGSCTKGNMTGMPALLQSPSVHSTELPSAPLPAPSKVGGDEGSIRGALTKLVISVLSKSVRLPENAATLSAYTVPAEQPGGRQKLGLAGTNLVRSARGWVRFARVE